LHFDLLIFECALSILSGLFVLEMKAFGLVNVDRAVALIKEMGGVEKAPVEALGWLLPTLIGDERTTLSVALAQNLLRHLGNRVTETAGKVFAAPASSPLSYRWFILLAQAHFVSSVDDAGAHLLLHSEGRTDAIVLDALLMPWADNDKSAQQLVDIFLKSRVLRMRHSRVHVPFWPVLHQIPKLVAGLMGAQRKGRWYNTQENAWALISLDRYFHKFEANAPDFVASFWIG
jgi:alpha-2-macroglobulin